MCQSARELADRKVNVSPDDGAFYAQCFPETFEEWHDPYEDDDDRGEEDELRGIDWDDTY